MPTPRSPATPLRGGNACWAPTRSSSPAPTSMVKRLSVRRRLLAKRRSSTRMRFRRNSASSGSGWEFRMTTSFAPRKSATRSGCRNCSSAFATTATFTRARTPGSTASRTNSTWMARSPEILARPAGASRRRCTKRITSSNCRPFTQPVEVFGAEDLAAVDGLFGVGERIGHPVIHAEVEIGHDEDRRLELLGEIESLKAHRKTLFRRTREEQGVPGVAVGEQRGGNEVALLGARGQPGGWADALHVENHRGAFGVIPEPDELRHQRNTRAGRSGHGTGARPARAQRHADGSQLIFGLNDGIGGFAGIGIVAEALGVADQRFDQR